MAFVKRTLARCHKYEDTGRSCFREPPLHEILLATPPYVSDEKSNHFIGTTNMHNEAYKSPPELRVSGHFSIFNMHLNNKLVKLSLPLSFTT